MVVHLLRNSVWTDTDFPFLVFVKLQLIRAAILYTFTGIKPHRTHFRTNKIYSSGLCISQLINCYYNILKQAKLKFYCLNKVKQSRMAYRDPPTQAHLAASLTPPKTKNKICPRRSLNLMGICSLTLHKDGKVTW